MTAEGSPSTGLRRKNVKTLSNSLDLGGSNDVVAQIVKDVLKVIKSGDRGKEMRDASGCARAN